MPWDTAFIAVALFLVVSGLMAIASQRYAALYRDQAWLDRLVQAFCSGDEGRPAGHHLPHLHLPGKNIFATRSTCC